LYWAALLHDVGKIGMPEAILNKPSPLEEDEFQIVREHPERGWRMLHSVPELALAATGIRHHHERWDGTGYPRQLAGEEIPILARILCVADAFDAIISNRSYRKGQSPTRAVELIEECAGEQFDPQIVAALRRLLPLLERHRWVLMSGQKTSFRY
jgi:HD-GYP domain-containing protein (c-di-GMP phosphodiesterase class II)